VKPIILSHRYLLNGKERPDNKLSQLKAALTAGFSFFETDIRRLKTGEFYISHDPQDSITSENDAKLHMALWRESGAQIALNIKELGYEEDLVAFLKEQDVTAQVFLFDFDIEFIGAEPQSYINSIHALDPELRCAVRISDHNEPVERAIAIKGSSIIWIDEFDSLWVTQQDMQALKAAGKTVYCIAPDLHGFGHEQVVQRFKDFTAWGADGICTDFALELKEFLK